MLGGSAPGGWRAGPVCRPPAASTPHPLTPTPPAYPHPPHPHLCTHPCADIKTADWSEEVAPFWGEVIKSAFTAEGISGLLKAGWTTIKGALVRIPAGRLLSFCFLCCKFLMLPAAVFVHATEALLASCCCWLLEVCCCCCCC